MRPTEVVPVPASSRTQGTLRCLNIAAGEFRRPHISVLLPPCVVLVDASGFEADFPSSIAGDLSMFTVERRNGSSIDRIDVTACGNGQYGGLGNGVFSNAQRTPAKIKTISGLLECAYPYQYPPTRSLLNHTPTDDEGSSSLQPIVPHSISISPSGHVLCALETRARAGAGAETSDIAGRDLLSWGFNADSQLGNGKKNTLAVPTNVQVRRAVEGGQGEQNEPRRYMLRKRKAGVVRDMKGEVWKKGVEVEQVAVAGPGCSAVYWRIC